MPRARSAAFSAFGQVVGKRRVAPLAPGNREVAGDAVGVALRQALGQQAAIAAQLPVGKGGKAAFVVFGALGEG